MQQQFALTLSPQSGRVSLRPVVHGLMHCKPFMTFADESKARAFLDKSQAVKVRGGATINGTYQMEIVPQQEEVI